MIKRNGRKGSENKGLRMEVVNWKDGSRENKMY